MAIATVVVIAAVAGYVLYTSPASHPRLNIPPHLVEVLANGSTWLDVPLMTLYTPSAPQSKSFDANVSLSFSSAAEGPNSTFALRWGNVSGTTEPVRFVLSPTIGQTSATAFRAGGPNEFLALPAGNCSEPGANQGWGIGLGGADTQEVYHERWLMTYTISRMEATVASVEQRWIQVNYSLDGRGSYGDFLPAANTSVPTPADFVPLGGVMEFNLSKGSTVGVLLDAHDALLSVASFRHALPPMSLNAGAAGNVSVVLTSEFRWGPADGYWLGWTVTAQKDGIVRAQDFVDARFGSLIVQFLP